MYFHKFNSQSICIAEKREKRDICHETMKGGACKYRHEMAQFPVRGLLNINPF